MMNPIALNASVHKIIANDNLLWYRQGEGEHKGLAYVKLRHMAAIILLTHAVCVCVCVFALACMSINWFTRRKKKRCILFSARGKFNLHGSRACVCVCECVRGWLPLIYALCAHSGRETV